MPQQSTFDDVKLPDNFQARGWRYQFYSVSHQPGHFCEADILLTLWQEKRAACPEGHLPSWDQFDFSEFKGLWGRIMVCQIECNPFDVRTRLWGTVQTDILKYERTDMLLSESSEGGRHDISNDLRYYDLICQTPVLGYREGGIFWQDRDHMTISYLDLPLASDGKKVDRLVSCFSYALEEA